MENGQRRTDIFFGYLFVLFIVMWIILTIYVLNFIPPTEIDEGVIYSTNRTLSSVIVIILTGLSTIGYMFLSKTIIKINIYPMMCFIFFRVVLLAFAMGSLKDLNLWKVLTIVIIFLIFIHDLSVLYSANKVKVDTISQIISESCRAIFNNFKLVYFFTLMNFLCASILCLTQLITIRNNKLTTEADTNSLILWCTELLATTLVYGIQSFAHMVIAESVANWYWSMDKNNVAKISISESSIRILSYHLGTIGFASTHILPFFYSLYVATVWKEDPNRSSNNITETLFSLITKLNLVIFTTNHLAVIQTSMHGYDFRQSAKKIFDLVLYNSYHYLAIIHISYYVFLYVQGLINSKIGSAIVERILLLENEYMEQIDVIGITMDTVSITYLPLVSLLIAAVRTMFLCILEDLEINRSSGRPYYMSNDLQQLFLNTD